MIIQHNDYMVLCPVVIEDDILTVNLDNKIQMSYTSKNHCKVSDKGEHLFFQDIYPHNLNWRIFIINDDLEVQVLPPYINTSTTKELVMVQDTLKQLSMKEIMAFINL